MKVLGKILEIMCKLMTNYFLVWCPKERKLNCSNSIQDIDKNLIEYRDKYMTVTRW